MNWLSVLLPVWIIGAPLVYSVFDWVRDGKVTSAVADIPDVRRQGRGEQFLVPS